LGDAAVIARAGGLFHGALQCALQRSIEPASDCRNPFVVKLTEKG